MNSEKLSKRRVRAINILVIGVDLEEVFRPVQQGRFWLSKWTCRYQAIGMEGLLDLRHLPKLIRDKTFESLVCKILALRDGMAVHKTQRAAFVAIGAKAIHFELQRRGCLRLPAFSTIEKILAQAGKIKKAKTYRLPGGLTYPSVRQSSLITERSRGS